MDVVQNGRDLLHSASPRQEHYQDELMRIPEANRIIHLDCRPCNPEEPAGFCSLFALPIVDQNRWTHVRLQTSTLSEEFSARQPQASVIPKLILTSGVSRFWKISVSRPAQYEDGLLEMAFLAVVQGNGGSAVKKVIVASEYPQVATTIFNEAINGYSIVFTGACLTHQLEKARDYGPNRLAVVWIKVTSLYQTFEIGARARGRGENERLVTGVLC